MSLDGNPPLLLRTFRLFGRFCWALLAVLLIVGLALRWDRLGNLANPRWQAILTVAALGVGTWLAAIQARSASRHTALAAFAAAALLLSQLCFLLLVWTSLKTQPAAWRCWWLSFIPAVGATHILWLRVSAAHDRRRLRRATIACALAAGAMLAGLAIRSNILDPVPPVYTALITVTLSASALGSLILWLRGIRLSPSRRVPAAVKIGWIVAAQVLIALGAFYAGRITASGPAFFELFPSPLSHLRAQELEFQVRTDLERLHIIARGIDELGEKASRLSGEIRASRARQARDYYTPAEEDEIRGLFMSYLAYRAALLRLAATYAGFESVRDPAARSKCFLIGYAAGALVFEASSRLARTYGEDSLARRKLNEGSPEWGVPVGMFDRIQDNLTNTRNIDTMAEMAAYFATHRAQLASPNTLPPADLQWIVALIDRAQAQIQANPLSPTRARLERLLAQVRKDTYTPVYAAQSLVSTWIGDTRLVEWQPFIRREQILEMQKQLQPGDILLERRNWFLSNAFLPGFWPHSAIYIGGPADLERIGLLHRDGTRWTSPDPAVQERLAEYLRMAEDGYPHTVIEAVSEGVIFNSLTESMHADYVAVLRPRLTDQQKMQAISRAFTHIGKPYDFEFDFQSADKLVCTEVVYRSYDGLLRFPQPLPRIMGRHTLPALEIAAMFERGRGTPDQQLDFVLFLDGLPSDRCARLADETVFCASIRRPRGFNE